MFSICRRIPRLRTNVRAFTVNLETFGQHSFSGAVAAPFLKEQGLPENTLDNGKWIKAGHADKVSGINSYYFAIL